MQRFLTASLVALTFAGAVAGVAPTAAFAATAPALPAPAPLASLVKAVDIPYEQFTLPNGLRVLVHTDRKAPVVAVSIWYGVGSKNEPKGKTGFAHLFEHLMFNGSEHNKGDYFTPLQNAGATDYNGTTWFDRTNYFETVPSAALDRFLMLESDRMGYLLGAVTQETLDNQRSVVQNEKRQGDNEPYGLVQYEQLENLYPSGHPYHHNTIGSMGDLDSASLADVKGWFTDHYAPNNAVLVLAGDVDLATAKAKVARWFGAIPSGPKVQPVAAPVPTLPAPIAKTIKDEVATTRLYRMWAIPGYDNPEYLPLQIGAVILGGLASSRLDDNVVRGQQLAVDASANAEVYAQAGQFVVQADVKPGQDAAKVGAALDAEIARLVTQGPTADELARAATVTASDQIRKLESVGGFGGKAPTLAEGLLYHGDAGYYRKELAAMAALTPAQVRDALRKYLTRPVFALTVEPGTRTAGGEARAGFAIDPNQAGGGAHPAYWHKPGSAPAPLAATTAAATGPDRSELPPIGTLAPLEFPRIERTTLANGIKVVFARRAAVPVVSVQVAFDAGIAADPHAALGTQALLLKMMDQGTERYDAAAFARARENLGAVISNSALPDSTAFQLDAVTPNLAGSLDLLADYVVHPAVRPSELERVRAQQLAAIDAELRDPSAMASRVLYPVLYGPQHPYGTPPTGTGDPAVVKRLTRDELVAFHDAWYRPSKATIFVVGDTTLAAVKPLLEKSFGSWVEPAAPAPAKNLSAAIPAPRPRILLVDRPASPQSTITAGVVLDTTGRTDLVPLRAANDVLGGSFLSRLNMDVRESKGWSYGVGSAISERQDRIIYRLVAPVQTDQTGPAIAAMTADMDQFLKTKGVAPDELAWATQGSARELPGAFETSSAVLGGLVKIVQFNRPDDYYTRLALRYPTLTAADLDGAARKAIDPSKLTWVIVGDAAKVRPQLDKLGLPVEVATVPGK
jgi:hypothetical protein